MYKGNVTMHKQNVRAIQYGLKVDTQIKAGGWQEDIMKWLNGFTGKTDQAASGSTTAESSPAAPVAAAS